MVARKIWRELRYWSSSRGYLRLVALSMVLTGGYLIAGAVAGPDTGLVRPIGLQLSISERVLAGALGMAALLAGSAVLRMPRSHRR
jgi:hypothetical protein